jgi:uncharacterized protein YacL
MRDGTRGKRFVAGRRPAGMNPFGPWSVASVVLQSGVDIDITPVDPLADVAGSAVGAFVTTLVVGAILVTVAPDYVRRLGRYLRDEPVGSFVYGLISLVGVILVTVLLVITIIGILLAIPFAILAWVIWAVGASIAFLAIAEELVSADDGWLKPLVVAALLNGGLTITGIGGIVAFCIGAAGFGAVLRDYLE